MRHAGAVCHDNRMPLTDLPKGDRHTVRRRCEPNLSTLNVHTRNLPTTMVQLMGSLQQRHCLWADVRSQPATSVPITSTPPVLRRHVSYPERLNSRSGSSRLPQTVYVERQGERGWTCPVASTLTWMDTAGIQRGALFRAIDRWGNLRDQRLSGEAINDVLRTRAADVGMDLESLSAHGLRSGAVTQHSEWGVPEPAIMAMTRHKSRDMLDHYDRPTVGFDNAAGHYVPNRSER